MRYVLKLEAIGDNYQDYRCRFERSRRAFDRRALDAYRYGNQSLAASCRRVTRGTAGLQYQTIPGQKDYTDANGNGSRGIYFYYALAPGAYEITEPMRFGQSRRYFLHIDESGAAREIAQEQVESCISKHSESTS